MNSEPLPRVLLLNEFASLNGGERSLVSVAELLREHIDVVAAVPGDGDLADALSGIRIKTIAIDLPVANSKESGDDVSRQIDQRILSLVADVQPDIVHANSLNMSRHLGRIAGQLPIPTLGHCRDIIRLSAKAISDLNKLSRMIFVSKAAFKFHVENGYRAEQGTVIYNGVDIEHFRPTPASGELRRELGISNSSQLLLSIGQIGMRKGLDFLMDAFEIVCRTHVDAHLLIVGKRYSQKDEAIAYERTLIERSKNSPFSSRVHFLGLRNDVAQLMNEADLLVHAARQEPLGRVMLEACAAGLPAVVTNVGGTSEIYPTDSSGAILVSKEAVRAFADGILTLLDDEKLRISFGKHGRLRAESAFDRRLSAACLADAYRSLLVSKQNDKAER